MGTTAAYFLADWPRLVQVLKKVSSAEEYLARYGVDEQPWLEPVEMPSEHEHGNAATVAYYVHEAIASELTPATRSKLEALLRPFGIIVSNEGQDLGFYPEFFHITLSPATVARVLAESEGLDWEEVGAAYLRLYKPQPNWWLSSRDEFIAYLLGFVDLLENAKRHKYGVVVFVG